MAAITPSRVNRGPNFTLWKWVALSATDTTGVAVDVRKFRDKTVQLFGTFGGTVTIQGSLDLGVTWFTLNDFGGTPIAKTAAGGFLAAEGCTHFRPLAGAGVVAVDVWLLAGR